MGLTWSVDVFDVSFLVSTAATSLKLLGPDISCRAGSGLPPVALHTIVTSCPACNGLAGSKVRSSDVTGKATVTFCKHSKDIMNTL